jgi:HAD superfamily hydrolase (TIGR01509 family)
MPARIKGVIFDLDGTLIDSIECYLIAFNGALGRKLFPAITRVQLLHFLNQGYHFEQMFQELGIQADAGLITEVRGYMHALYLEHEKDIPLLPGAAELLAELKANGGKIGIATGRAASGDVRWRELRRLGVHHFLDAVVTGADARPKPAPDTLVECVRQLELQPAECVMVGDSIVDIVAAREAGMPSLAVTTGVATRENLLVEKPLFVFDDLIQLRPSLVRWLVDGQEGYPS